MKLIDADNLAFPIANFIWKNQYHIQKLLRRGEVVELLEMITECVSELKADYDVEKVIEQMYAARPQPGFMSDELIDFEGLIEIVKQGGADESNSRVG